MLTHRQRYSGALMINNDKDVFLKATISVFDTTTFALVTDLTSRLLLEGLNFPCPAEVKGLRLSQKDDI